MKTITFGIMVKDGTRWTAVRVPIDGAAQEHLESMFHRTEEKLLDATRLEFELAEKYDDAQCAVLPLKDELAGQIRTLYEAGNLPIDSTVLNDLDTVVGYFGIIDEDGQARRLGMRQARTFKSLRSKPVWTLSEGQLMVDTRPMFTLADSWEIEVKDEELVIVSATALERICDLTPVIRSSAKAALDEIAPQLPFINFEPLKSRVEKYTRSARIVADIRRRGDLDAIKEMRLISQSDAQNIDYEVIDHKYVVKVGSEESLLMLLDRRRYVDPLVTENPDIYEADSRHKVGKAKKE